MLLLSLPLPSNTPSGPVSSPSPLRHHPLSLFRHRPPSFRLLALSPHPSSTSRHMLFRRPLALRHRLSPDAPPTLWHRPSPTPSAPSLPAPFGQTEPNGGPSFGHVWPNGGPWPNKGIPFSHIWPNEGPPFGHIWPNGGLPFGQI